MSDGLYRSVSAPRTLVKNLPKPVLGVTNAGVPELSADELEFIERMSRAGVGALFFGQVVPFWPDSSHSRQMLVRMSYLYRRFLAPVGMKIFVENGEATLSGAVGDRVAPELAELLARQIPGIDSVRDESYYDESALRIPTGKTTKLPTLSAPDGLLRDQLLACLEMDQKLAGYSYEVSVGRSGLKLLATVPNEETSAWLHRYVAGWKEAGRLHLLVTVDAETEAEKRRKPRPDEESLQAMLMFRLRQQAAWTRSAGVVHVNATTVQIKAAISAPEDREWLIEVARTTSGVTVVDFVWLEESQVKNS